MVDFASMLGTCRALRIVTRKRLVEDRFTDRLRANSNSYLPKRIGNMDRLGGFAVDSWKIRQVPSKIFVSPFFSRLLHSYNLNMTAQI